MVPKVMIILGSGSDIDIAKKSIKILEELEIPYSLKIASAHRTPFLVEELVKQATGAGIKVFIGIAGLAAHLPGAIAAYTSRPVIGVPVAAKLDGLDSLYSSVQMPYPTPVATVGIDRGENAAILAAQIIGLSDENVAKRISKLRKDYEQKVIRSNEEIIQKLDGEYIENNFLRVKNLETKKPSNQEYSEFNYDADVSIIASSHADIVIAKKVAVILDRMKIEYDTQIICPIRNHNKFQDYVIGMANTDIFIGISSNSALITGELAALTEKPIIGVPCTDSLGGNSLLTMVNMPPGVPVATVGIGNGRNAAILAGEILAISNSDVKENLAKIRNKKINI